MPDASQVFDITVPAGNGMTIPVSYPLSIGLAEVVNCILTWPAGCCGLVGVALLAANSWAFPVKSNTYYAFDDFKYSLAVTNQIQTGNWLLNAYNTDYFAHTIQVVLEYDYVVTDQLANQSLQIGI